MNAKKTLILGTSPADLSVAGDIIRQGGLVVFPTETVYGLGANAFDPAACAKIFAAKGRPADNPLIVHVSDIFCLTRVVKGISRETAALIEAFMPGPLTLILPKNARIPGEVTAGLPTVGVRVPSNPVAREFLRKAGVPVAAPSANESGRPSATTFTMAWNAMEGKADAIIRGGDSEIGLESTILRLRGRRIDILRPGGISEEDIRRVTGDCKIRASFPEKRKTGPAPAPGMKYTHYKPQADVFLYRDMPELRRALQRYQGKKIGVLTLGPAPESSVPENPPDREHLVSVREMASPESYARRLYAEFFIFDTLGCEIVLAAYPAQEGIGSAIGNRLLKAAGGKFADAD